MEIEDETLTTNTTAMLSVCASSHTHPTRPAIRHFIYILSFLLLPRALCVPNRPWSITRSRLTRSAYLFTILDDYLYTNCTTIEMRKPRSQRAHLKHRRRLVVGGDPEFPYWLQAALYWSLFLTSRNPCCARTIRIISNRQVSLPVRFTVLVNYELKGWGG